MMGEHMNPSGVLEIGSESEAFGPACPDVLCALHRDGRTRHPSAFLIIINVNKGLAATAAAAAAASTMGQLGAKTKAAANR